MESLTGATVVNRDSNSRQAYMTGAVMAHNLVTGVLTVHYGNYIGTVHVSNVRVVSNARRV